MRFDEGRPLSTREITVLLTMCLVWGFHFVVIKVAVDAVPPMFYAAIRMTLVAIVMARFLCWRPGYMIRVLSAGVFMGGVNYAFMFSGIALGTASAGAIAIELYVPFATILSVLFLQDHVGWRRGLGIALAFVGVAVIALGKGEASIGVGVGLVAIAAFSESIGAILIKKSMAFKPFELLAWFSVIGTVVLWSATMVFENGQVEAFQAADKWLLTGAILFSAFGGSIFGHSAYYWLLQRLPVSQVAPSALLTTVIAVFFSVLLLGDPLSTRLFIGGAMTLVGVGIVLLRGPKTRPPTSRPLEAGAPESLG